MQHTQRSCDCDAIYLYAVRLPMRIVVLARCICDDEQEFTEMKNTFRGESQR